MKKIFFQIFILWALISNTHLAQAASPPFIPKGGKLLIIGQQKDTINAYIKNVGIVPGGFMVYTSIQLMDGLVRPAEHDAGINHAQYYVDHYPNTVIQLALYMVGALDQTLSGQYDRNIVKLANWMKSVTCPIYFRIGYEFDLPENGYDPQKYQEAYRYIVDHLRAQGVHNVAYVWHTACLTESQGDFLDWYPGDDYVDWFAVSLFNPMQIAIAKKFSIIALVHNKPLMIAESTPAGLFSTNAKKEWFRHYFDFINDNDVKVVCYINSDWNSYPLFQAQDWGDARIQSDAEIKAIWLKETGSGYLQSSPDLFNKLNSQYQLSS